MTIKSIVTDRKALARWCDPAVTKTDNYKKRVVRDLLNTAVSHTNCAGLAANQIGNCVRIFVMKYQNTWLVCIDPMIIIKHGDKCYDREGCLSVPGVTKRIIRYKRIKVQYTDEHGEIITRYFNGLNARVFQHELDHINGVLIDDAR